MWAAKYVSSGESPTEASASSAATRKVRRTRGKCCERRGARRPRPERGETLGILRRGSRSDLRAESVESRLEVSERTRQLARSQRLVNAEAFAMVSEEAAAFARSPRVAAAFSRAT